MKEFQLTSKYKPTGDQPEAIRQLSEGVLQGVPAQTLLGVTGSGKTSVYMKLIDIAFFKRQGVIVLLPEIALTSQVINKFYERYGDKVSVYHSALTSKERLEQFKKVSDGTCSIVVGTRSAVFLPVKNLGLIIIDEEQEDSYKSESPPRYNTIDIAKYKCYFSNCLLLLHCFYVHFYSYLKNYLFCLFLNNYYMNFYCYY